jgi:hypothetical protein
VVCTQSIVLCPSCGAGQWLNYSKRTEWKATNPRHTTIYSQETINWDNRKNELVSRKTEQLALYFPSLPVLPIPIPPQHELPVETLLDPILCPVTAFAYLIRRIRLTVPNYIPVTPICAIYVDGFHRSITQQLLRDQLRLESTKTPVSLTTSSLEVTKNLQ